MQTHNTIIFDFDGTLIDSAPGILATYAAVLEEAGITPLVELDQSLIGPPLAPTMQRVIGLDNEASLPILVERFKQLYGDIGIAQTPAYPDAELTLGCLKNAGMQLYLATNKRAEPSLALLKKFGWGHFFSGVYCIDSHQPVFADKTAMLRQLLSENQLDPAQALYVGDTRGDYLSASACGIRFLAAQWGYEDWQAQPDSAEMLVNAYTSLAEIGDALTSRQ